MSERLPTHVHLTNFIRQEFPNLNEEEVQVAIYQLEGLVGEHLSRGDLLSFLSRYADGSLDLTVYDWTLEEED